MATNHADPLYELDGRNGIWAIPPWCAQYGCSEPYYYKLSVRPKEVRIGRKVRILESPAAYLERLREMQSAEVQTSDDGGAE